MITITNPSDNALLFFAFGLYGQDEALWINIVATNPVLSESSTFTLNGHLVTGSLIYYQGAFLLNTDYPYPLQQENVLVVYDPEIDTEVIWDALILDERYLRLVDIEAIGSGDLSIFDYLPGYTPTIGDQLVVRDESLLSEGGNGFDVSSNGDITLDNLGISSAMQAIVRDSSTGEVIYGDLIEAFVSAPELSSPLKKVVASRRVTAADVAVVYKPDNPASLQIANAYAALRGIPSSNMVPVDLSSIGLAWPTNYDFIPESEGRLFVEYLSPILDALLPKAVVFCGNWPIHTKGLYGDWRSWINHFTTPDRKQHFLQQAESLIDDGSFAGPADELATKLSIDAYEQPVNFIASPYPANAQDEQFLKYFYKGYGLAPRGLAVDYIVPVVAVTFLPSGPDDADVETTIERIEDAVICESLKYDDMDNVFLSGVTGASSASFSKLFVDYRGVNFPNEKLFFEGLDNNQYEYSAIESKYPKFNISNQLNGENLGILGEPGENTFIPFAGEVGFRGVGEESYYHNNFLHERPGDYNYRKGSISWFTQSYGATPSPQYGSQDDEPLVDIIAFAKTFSFVESKGNYWVEIERLVTGRTDLSAMERIRTLRVRVPNDVDYSAEVTAYTGTGKIVVYLNDVVEWEVVWKDRTKQQIFAEVYGPSATNPIPSGMQLDWGPSTSGAMDTPSRAYSSFFCGATFTTGVALEPHQNITPNNYLPILKDGGSVADAIRFNLAHGGLETAANAQTFIGDPLLSPFKQTAGANKMNYQETITLTVTNPETSGSGGDKQSGFIDGGTSLINGNSTLELFGLKVVGCYFRGTNITRICHVVFAASVDCPATPTPNILKQKIKGARTLGGDYGVVSNPTTSPSGTDIQTIGATYPGDGVSFSVEILVDTRVLFFLAEAGTTQSGYQDSSVLVSTDASAPLGYLTPYTTKDYGDIVGLFAKNDLVGNAFFLVMDSGLGGASQVATPAKSQFVGMAMGNIIFTFSAAITDFSSFFGQLLYTASDYPIVFDTGALLTVVLFEDNASLNEYAKENDLAIGSSGGNNSFIGNSIIG